MNPDGSKQMRLTHTGDARDLKWSPLGDQICYISRGDLWLVNVATGMERRLTSGVERNMQPTWSPDSRAIAFITPEVSQPEMSLDQAQVQLIALDTSEQKQLGMASPRRMLAWSPNSTHLAFVSPGREFQNVLFSINTQTLELTQLTGGDDYILNGIAWAADGHQVFYMANGGIYAVTDDGRDQTLVIRLENIATFGTRNMALSPNGDLVALTHGDNLGISKIWVANLPEGSFTLASSGW